MNKLKTLLAATGLAALALSGCGEKQQAGANGFSCEQVIGGIGFPADSRLYVTKGDKKVIVNYFSDKTRFEISNLGYQAAVDAVMACEEAIDNLPKPKVEKEE